MPEANKNRPARFFLIVLMVLGGLMLWFGNPVIWLWIGSQLTTSQQGQFGPYMLVAFGILISTIAVAMALARLNTVYQRLAGEATVRVPLPWMRSLRDQQGETRVTVLDFIMVTTAIAAITTFFLWFFLLAGSPIG
jgi:hypothetical protein